MFMTKGKNVFNVSRLHMILFILNLSKYGDKIHCDGAMTILSTFYSSPEHKVIRVS